LLGARGGTLRFARTCYDHLAGHLGVTIADALVADGHIVLGEDGGEVTDGGRIFLAAFGADLTSGSKSKRIFCKPCLDWSERRYHLAGWVGAEISRCCVDTGWIVREHDTRAVRLTSVGQAGLSALFGIASLETSFAHPKSEALSAINAKPTPAAM
jgi:hypothetical protein